MIPVFIAGFVGGVGATLGAKVASEVIFPGLQSLVSTIVSKKTCGECACQKCGCLVCECESKDEE